VRTSNTGFASTFDFGTTDGESEEMLLQRSSGFNAM
jgi:hypothetical protein